MLIAQARSDDQADQLRNKVVVRPSTTLYSSSGASTLDSPCELYLVVLFSPSWLSCADLFWARKPVSTKWTALILLEVDALWLQPSCQWRLAIKIATSGFQEDATFTNGWICFSHVRFLVRSGTMIPAEVPTYPFIFFCSSGSNKPRDERLKTIFLGCDNESVATCHHPPWCLRIHYVLDVLPCNPGLVWQPKANGSRIFKVSVSMEKQDCNSKRTCEKFLRTNWNQGGVANEYAASHLMLYMGDLIAGGCCVHTFPKCKVLPLFGRFDMSWYWKENL